MKKKSKKQPMLATPYLEFWSELTDKEASMISGGEIIQKITVNREINGCSQSGTLHYVNGKIIEDTIKTECKDKLVIDFKKPVIDFTQTDKYLKSVLSFEYLTQLASVAPDLNS